MDLLGELRRYGLPDAPVEPELASVVRLAARLTGAPRATLNVLTETEQRQYVTAGFEGRDSPREESMCAVTLREGCTLMVPDARQDPRFVANPFVDGRRADVRMYVSVPLVSADGVALGTLCVFDDQPRTLGAAEVAGLEDLGRLVLALLERRRLADEAQAAVRAKTAFLAAVSHEMRTPLHGVLGMLDLLLAADLPAAQQRQAEVASRSAAGLLALLDDVLDLAKGEVGRVVLQRRPFDPALLVEDVVAGLAVLGARKGVPVVVRTEGRVPALLEGDPERLRQVLVNLVGNAVKFTDAGSVEVVLRAPDLVALPGTVVPLRLQVRDTGEGIPADEQARLFEPFEQGRAGRRCGGTGLGLAISAQLVQLMGGTIAVSSEPGDGTSLLVELALPVAAPTAPEPEPVPAALDHLRVLVVDDDPVNRLVAVGLLGSLGVDAVAVEDGQAALDAVRDSSWDAVLVDYEMPGLTGPEVVRRLRAGEGAGAAVPVVGLTGRTRREDVQEGLAAGMEDVLRKPVAAEELAAALRRVTS